MLLHLKDKEWNGQSSVCVAIKENLYWEPETLIVPDNEIVLSNRIREKAELIPQIREILFSGNKETEFYEFYIKTEDISLPTRMEIVKKECEIQQEFPELYFDFHIIPIGAEEDIEKGEGLKSLYIKHRE